MAGRVLTCETHPRYTTAAPPSTECPVCWAAYGHRRAYDDGLRSQGKVKKKYGSAVKVKGRNAVLLVVARLLEYFQLPGDDIIVKATSQGGCDIHMSPRAAALFPYAVEVKAQEGLNVWAALRQADANAEPGRTPILFFKRAQTELYVALRASDFLRLLPNGQEKSPVYRDCSAG